MKKNMAQIVWQLIVSLPLFIFAVAGTALAVFANRDLFVAVCFGLMAFATYNLMLAPTLRKLAKSRTRHRTAQRNGARCGIV